MDEPSKPDPAELRIHFWKLPLEAYVDRLTAGAPFYLGGASMEALAIHGGGPPYLRIARRALYLKSDLLKWAEQSGRRVESTAQLVPAPPTAPMTTPAQSAVSPRSPEVALTEPATAPTKKASVMTREPAAVAKAQATRKARIAAREGALT